MPRETAHSAQSVGTCVVGLAVRFSLLRHARFTYRRIGIPAGITREEMKVLRRQGLVGRIGAALATCLLVGIVGVAPGWGRTARQWAFVVAFLADIVAGTCEFAGMLRKRRASGSRLTSDLRRSRDSIRSGLRRVGGS